MGASSPPSALDAAVATQPQSVAWPRHIPHCASTRHPAFFTDRLRRAPPAFASGVLDSPVTQGYVYQETERRKPKL
ncbi:hypothetical protein ACJ41O_013295 [Fusarium nematophilum]